MRKLLTGDRRRGHSAAVSVCACLCVVTVASASYESDFDDLNGSPSGVVLTGQDGYYLPAGTTSTDFLVYTYVDNALGIVQNPEGGTQFVGGTGPGSPTFARAQRDVDFGDGTETWLMTYDFACLYTGTGPSAQNIGSVSVMSSVVPDIDYIHLFSWVDPNDPVSFNAFYMAYDAAGNQFPQPGASPGPEWEGLEVNHWYRGWIMLELASNRIVEVGIVDLETGVEAVFGPADWYLEGGAAGGVGPPISFRFFAGGGVPGNVAVFDNMSIVLVASTPVKEASWGRIKEMYKR
jgi:hypothetical protein